MKRLVHQLKPAAPGTHAEEITWIDVQPPNPATVNFLQQEFGFHPFILQELLVPTLRTKVERYDQYLFLVLHFPVYDKRTRETHSHELDVLATPDTVITVHPKSIEPLKTLFDKLNESEHLRGKTMGQGAGVLLYHIIDALIEALFPTRYLTGELSPSLRAPIYVKRRAPVDFDWSFPPGYKILMHDGNAGHKRMQALLAVMRHD